MSSLHPQRRVDPKPTSTALRATRVFSLVAGLGLAALLGAGGCWCGSDEDADATSAEQPGDDPAKPAAEDTQARPPRVSSESSDGAPMRATVHDADELAAIPDLGQLESLDLALSLIDARTRPLSDDAPLVERDQCDAIDLRVIASRAPKLRHLRISGCAALVHAGLQSFRSLRSLELADGVLDDVTIARIAQLERLESLTLVRMQSAEASVVPLVRGPAIRRLVLRELENDSLIGDMLGDLPSLREVRLEGAWAGHRAMLSLSKARKLQRLELVETSVGNFSLNQVHTLEQLREVHWVGTTFNDNSPLHLRDLPVESLYCDCPSLGDTGLRHLRYLTVLRELHLEQSATTAEGLEALSKLEALQRLFLGDVEIDAIGFAALAELPKLRELFLEGGVLLDPEAEGLPAVRDLHALSLHLEGVGDATTPAIGALVGLRRLELGRTDISDDGLEGLAPLTALEELELSHTRVTKAGLSHLAGMAQLRRLALDHTDVVDAGVAHLAPLHALEELRLDHTLVTDACIGTLTQLPKLEALDLSATVVSEAGLAELRKAPALKRLGVLGSRAERDREARLEARSDSEAVAPSEDAADPDAADPDAADPDAADPLAADSVAADDRDPGDDSPAPAAPESAAPEPPAP